MAAVFGLDFGTTNSLISVVVGGRVISLTNQADDLAHPSVVWYNGAEVVVGRAAKQHLDHVGTGVIGDVIHSPKAFLGKGTNIHVGGVARDPTDVVAEILRFIQKDACDRRLGNLDFSRAVMTIPVTMDGKARRELREAALKADIRVHQFVHEPFAALYGYLRSKADFERRIADLQNKLVLVVDWGGGTLDLTLCKIVGRTVTQILNKGDDRVGGDQFDGRLVRFVRDSHARIHNLSVWPGQIPGAEAKLLSECELSKIALSTRTSATVLVPHYLQADGPERTLEVVVSRDDLEDVTKDLVTTGMTNINELLDQAGVKEAGIELCLATGGMVNTPAIRKRLIEQFGIARVPTDVRGDRVIAEGAAWIAHDNLRLKLAKPLELLHADDTYVSLLREGTPLPTESQNEFISCDLYCVDPKDGFAKLQFVRPKWPGRNGPSEPRDCYAVITLGVDRTAEPLFERLNVGLTIDQDMIVNVSATSSLAGDKRLEEIYDLEFGIEFGADHSSAIGGGTNREPDESQPRLHGRGQVKLQQQPPGTIRLRSNVSLFEDAWDLVPGDVIKTYRNRYLYHRDTLTAFQVKEAMYYAPCSNCGLFINRIKVEGCERCGITPSPLP